MSTLHTAADGRPCRGSGAVRAGPARRDGRTPADPRAALDWFVKAAAQHHLMALNMVGRCYDLGWGTTPDKDARGAMLPDRRRAGAGFGAMYNYATLLALGDGVAEDKVAALDWLHRAVAAGEGVQRAKAMNFIGSFAEDGWAGPVDLAAGGGLVCAGRGRRRFPRLFQPCADAGRRRGGSTKRCAGCTKPGHGAMPASSIRRGAGCRRPQCRGFATDGVSPR